MDDIKEGLGRISTVREVVNNSIRIQLGRTSEKICRQQMSRYHAQNMGNIVTLRLQQPMTNKPSQIPPRVGGVEWIRGNKQGCTVHKRPFGRRWSSPVCSDNNKFRGIPEHLDGDERREEQKLCFCGIRAEPHGGKPQNWQTMHNGDNILDTSFR